MSVKAEVKWQTLRTIAHSIMVHTRFSEEYIYIVLMYTTHHIFPILLIKLLVNKDGEPTTTHKLATGMKPSASKSYVLFFQVLY